MPPRAWLVGIVIALAACEHAPPVAWSPPKTTPGAPPANWMLALDANDRPVTGTMPVIPFVPPAGACAASLVFARSGGAGWFAAWWQPRPDGGASLVVSRSADDGSTWTVPSIADGRDRSTHGCDRPRPAIAADSASGYVHLAYYLRSPNGAGVWFTHSLDNGATWHAPVGVFFGDDPARVSVAADHDTVAVAFEWPNASEARVGVAISRTARHIFETRSVASSAAERASDPRVAVRGHVLVVGWTSRPPRAAAGDTIAAGVIRMGRIVTGR